MLKKLVQSFDSNGQLRDEGFIDHDTGKRCGTWKKWNEDGVLIKQQEYTDDGVQIEQQEYTGLNQNVMGLS